METLMISKHELLQAAEAAAFSRAELARVLNLPPARISEMFADRRELTFEEGRKLIEHYRLEKRAIGRDSSKH